MKYILYIASRNIDEQAYLYDERLNTDIELFIYKSSLLV